MHTVREKSQQIRSEMRKNQKLRIIAQLRDQLLRDIRIQQHKRDRIQLLLFVYHQIELQNHDWLNIFANIEQYLNELLFGEEDDPLQRKLALWLYIFFSSQPKVYRFIIQRNGEKQWNKLLFLLEQHPRYREQIYQRMAIFIETIVSTQIEGFFIKNNIFTQQTTKWLLNLESAQEEWSHYYELISLYLKYIPQEHLLVVIESGFAQKSMEFANQSIFLTILQKLQEMQPIDNNTEELRETLLEKTRDFWQLHQS